MAKYISLTGLSRFLANCKNLFLSKSDAASTYGTKTELDGKVDKVLMSKTYAPYTCSADNQNKGWIYFMNVVPTDDNWAVPWYIRYRLYVTTTETNTQGVYDCYISTAGTSLTYAVWNDFYSSSYFPIYHHLISYYNSAAKYANRATNPIKIGVRVQSARTPVSLARTYKIEVLEKYGCEVSFIDSIETFDSYYTDAKYGYASGMNGASQGLQEIGDINDVTTIYLSTSRIKAGTYGLKRYSLCMQDGDGNWQSFTTDSGNGTTKTKNPSGFKLGSRIYRVGISSDVNSGSVIGGTFTLQQNSSGFDLRYSFNIAANSSTVDGLIRYKPVYIVGTIGSDGLFYLADTWWTQTEPTTEDGKIYIKVAEAVTQDYDTDLPRQYRADLVFDGKPYAFKDGAFRPWDSVVERTLQEINSKVSISTLNIIPIIEVEDGVKVITGLNFNLVPNKILKIGDLVYVHVDDSAITDPTGFSPDQAGDIVFNGEKPIYDFGHSCGWDHTTASLGDAICTVLPATASDATNNCDGNFLHVIANNRRASGGYGPGLYEAYDPESSYSFITQYSDGTWHSDQN